MNSFSIGIIGGTGVMGRWFKTCFNDMGVTVVLWGRKSEMALETLCRTCDVIMLSVPLDVAVKMADEVGPLLDTDQCLIDVCSTKREIVPAMTAATRAEVLGTHPLFGPYPKTIRGQNVIFCRGRGSRWADRLRALLEGAGAVVTEMAPQVHDQNMAVYQGLTHLLTISMAQLLKKLSISPDLVMRSSTPVFRINLQLMGRLLAQDLDLYELLIGKNDQVPGLLNLFRDTLTDVEHAVVKGARGEGVQLMEDLRAYFGDFCDEALADSNRLLDHLYPPHESA